VCFKQRNVLRLSIRAVDRHNGSCRCFGCLGLGFSLLLLRLLLLLHLLDWLGLLDFSRGLDIHLSLHLLLLRSQAEYLRGVLADHFKNKCRKAGGVRHFFFACFSVHNCLTSEQSLSSSDSQVNVS